MAGINGGVWYAGVVYDFHSDTVVESHMTKDTWEAMRCKQAWHAAYGGRLAAREAGYRILHYAQCTEAEALHVCKHGRINYLTETQGE